MRPHAASRRSRFVRLLILSAFPILTAETCAEPQPTLPPHIRTVAIETFQNGSHQEGIEQEVTRRVLQAFLTTSRLVIVPRVEDADAVLHGTITRYERTPLSYDQTGRFVHYKIRILADVAFEDRVRGGAAWRVDNIDGVTTYSLVSVPPETEDEAIIRASEEMARDILFILIEGRQDTSDDLLFSPTGPDTNVGVRRR